MLLRDALHQLHHQLVVVGGDIGGGVKGRQFVLGGGGLVVLGLGHDAQLPQLLVQLLHVGLHLRLDGAEIVVVQLLALGRLCPEEGAPGVAQVAALPVQLPRDQEILLLRPDGGGDAVGFGIPHGPQKAQRLPVEGVHTAQQGGLFIQRFAGVAAEGGGDVQAVILDESGAGGVPGGVAPGLKGGAQAAAGEAAGIRLALDELPPGKDHDDALPRGGEEAVVLFGGDTGHGLEPVGKMGGAVIQRPCLHHVGDDIGHGGIQRLPGAYDLPQAAVGIVGQALLLYRIVKNKASEQFRDVAHRTHSFAAGRVGPHKIFHQFYHAAPVKSMRFAAGRAAFL